MCINQARKTLPGRYIIVLIALLFNIAANSKLPVAANTTPTLSLTPTSALPCDGTRHKPCFDDLDKFYPHGLSPQEVYKLIGGRVYLNHQLNPDKYYWWCALGISLVLNRAGYDIPRHYLKDEQRENPSALGSGADGKWYFYQYSEIVPYLKQELGDPLRFDPHKMSEEKTLSSLKGIIAFYGCHSTDFSGHITLWDGKQCGDYCMSSCDKGMLWVLR